MNCRQICQQLKMTAADRKKRLTNVADTEQFQRIIQTVSLPPRAEQPQGFSESQKIARRGSCSKEPGHD